MITALCAQYSIASVLAAPEMLAQVQIMTPPLEKLRLHVSSACGETGAVFNVTNRGAHWPRTGILKLYYADDHTLIGQRRLRLADQQKISFLVKKTIAAGRPVAVWIEPQWYERDFTFDAALTCH
ncbi:hypothetical protein [Magnetovibrio blakemorei]|uniref:hypothetical protein n=1 Tax=Magnetovibrio blakemorei TaxID=28181 RepID=UPI00147CE631|nr:hypothetical protein [Magnetovibrio blakemorei]